MKRTYLAMLATLAVLAAVLVATTTASARSEKRTRITIMVGGIDKVIYATATLAKNLGYYEKAGVDIYPLDSPAGVEEADALVAGQIDGGITSQPTIGRLLASGQARILTNLQDNAQSKKAFGGTFPSTCVYMRTDYVNQRPEAVQKFVNALVWTLKWIHGHSAAEI